MSGNPGKGWEFESGFWKTTWSGALPWAVATGEAAKLEVAEELVPCRVIGVPVFLAESQIAAADNEGPVAVMASPLLTLNLDDDAFDWPDLILRPAERCLSHVCAITPQSESGGDTD